MAAPPTIRRSGAQQRIGRARDLSVLIHRKHGGDRHDLADEYEADEQENEDHLEPLEAEEDEDEESRHDRRMSGNGHADDPHERKPLTEPPVHLRGAEQPGGIRRERNAVGHGRQTVVVDQYEGRAAEIDEDAGQREAAHRR